MEIRKRGAKLGKLIKEAREAKGYSTRKLGEAIGSTHSYIAKLEAGWFQSISPENIQALAEVLKVDPQDLFVLAGYRVPNGLPTLPTYLRTRYGDDLDDDAIKRMTAYFEFERFQHDSDQDSEPKGASRRTQS